MNEETFQGFLNGGIMVCLAMAVLSTALRWKKYQRAALPLGLAFGVFALLLYGLIQGWPMGGIVSIAILLMAMLIADAYFRSGSGPNP